MPLYPFQHPESNEVIEILLSMKETDMDKYRFWIDEHGIKWKRVWQSPNAAVNTNIDPYDKRQFVRSLEGKNDTLGNLWDRSKELSEKRAAREGKDPVRERYYADYAKTRKGELHPEQKKEHLKDKMKDLGYDIKI